MKQLSVISHKKNKDFVTAIFSQYLLNDAIDWVKANLEPEDVFDDEKLEEWAMVWADNNGYIKPGV